MIKSQFGPQQNHEFAPKMRFTCLHFWLI